VRIRTRSLLGLTALAMLALSACSQAVPQLAPPPAAAPAPAPPAAGAPQQAPGQFPQGQGQLPQGAQGWSGGYYTYQSQDQVLSSLGRRSSEGGYWPPSVQLGPSQWGNILYDGSGFPLYLSTNDSTQPPASHCTGACTQQFLPVLVNAQITYQNVDPSHIGSYVRSDGTQQLTYYSHPLYRYVGDLVSLQVTAHGFQNSWYAIAADGSIAGSH
jgi:predicted lipoprotein with Yx(FWY)xxD motif